MPILKGKRPIRSRVSRLTNRNGHSTVVTRDGVYYCAQASISPSLGSDYDWEHHIGLTQPLDELLITGDKTSVHIPMGVLSYHGSRGWDDPMYIKGVESKGSVSYHQNRDSYRKYLPARR